MRIWLVRIAAICGLFSLTGALGEFHFVLDQVASFRVQYLCGLLMALVVAIVIRAYALAAIVTLVCLVHGFAVAQMYFPIKLEQKAYGVDIKVMSSNLLVSSTSYDAQIKIIAEIDPDVIVFQEYSSDWDATLSKELKGYPHRVHEVRDSSFGIALYSKYEIVSSEIVALGRSTMPNVDAIVKIDSEEVRILGVHPPPPISSSLFALRNSQLRAIWAAVDDETRPVIVLGDLNTTPWSVHFKKVVGAGKLRDSRRGFGVLPTWPSEYLFALIPIDHILINNKIRTFDVGTQYSYGSDHKSIWAELAFDME